MYLLGQTELCDLGLRDQGKQAFDDSAARFDNYGVSADHSQRKRYDEGLSQPQIQNEAQLLVLRRAGNFRHFHQKGDNKIDPREQSASQTTALRVPLQ